MISRLISHRGNISKPIPERENKPSYIDAAIQLGYSVEVDLRVVNNKLWLGHDAPDTEVNDRWLSERIDRLWVHCKNANAAKYLGEAAAGYQYFCHSADSFVLTSTGKLWVHDLSIPLGNHSIIPLITIQDIEQYSGPPAAGYCTDYISYANHFLKEKGLL